MTLVQKICAHNVDEINGSGKLCQSCKDTYDLRYGGKQMDKVVVVVPRTGKTFSIKLTSITSDISSAYQTILNFVL